MRVVSREPEAHLIELLQLVQDNSQGWQAIAFQFAQLLEHYRSEYQIKIATNLMNDLLGDRDGAIYLCEDTTIYVVVRNFPRQLAEKMIFQLRYLFMDDPLSYTAEGDENPEFATIYDIESQWQDFMNICKRRLIVRVRHSQGLPARPVTAPHADVPPVSAAPVDTKVPAKPASTPPVRPQSAQPVTKKPVAANNNELKLFTAESLAAIERDMRDIDLTQTIRRQPICAAQPETPVRTVFDEMYINIPHLRQSMGIEVDLMSNRHLFKYLTQILDERMLDTIQRHPARYLAKPISLNFNVKTLLSNRFTAFDAAIRPSTKVSIVIEFQLADVFEDMAAFLLAKDVVQKLGYRVCLDGVSEHSLPQIDRNRLGFDLVKFIWNTDAKADANSEKNKKLSEAVRIHGNNRVILTRCDTKQAVEYGQALGISLFQGRYLDSIVNPRSSVKN